MQDDRFKFDYISDVHKLKYHKLLENLQYSYNQVTASASNGIRMKRQPLINTDKVSVTRFGIFENSFQKKFYFSVDRLTRVRAETLIDLFLECGIKNKVINVRGYDVKLSSLAVKRLMKVLKHNQTHDMSCACCGLAAQYVYFERNILDLTNPYFVPVFYGIDKEGLEVPLTIDHIQAASCGGKKNSAKNFQILCKDCNNAKGTIDDETFRKEYKLKSHQESEN